MTSRHRLLGRSTQGVCSRTQGRLDAAHLSREHPMQQRNTTTARMAALAGTALAVALVSGVDARAQSVTSANVRATPTYEPVGLYFSNPGSTSGCSVQYRVTGTSAWSQGL